MDVRKCTHLGGTGCLPILWMCVYYVNYMHVLCIKNEHCSCFFYRCNGITFWKSFRTDMSTCDFPLLNGSGGHSLNVQSLLQTMVSKAQLQRALFPSGICCCCKNSKSTVIPVSNHFLVVFLAQIFWLRSQSAFSGRHWLSSQSS